MDAITINNGLRPTKDALHLTCWSLYGSRLIVAIRTRLTDSSFATARDRLAGDERDGTPDTAWYVHIRNPEVVDVIKLAGDNQVRIIPKGIPNGRDIQYCIPQFPSVLI